MSKKSTRDCLLDYTYNELEKFGYNQASTTDILKKAKIPKGSMYHYFSSKHDLTLAVIKERVALKSIKLFEITSKDSHIEAIVEFIKDIDFSKKCYRYDHILHRLYIELFDDAIMKEELDKIYDKITQNISQKLQLAMDCKEIKTVNPSKLSRFIISSIFGFISLKDELSKDILIEYLNDLKVHKRSIKREKKIEKKIIKNVQQGSLF